MSYRDCSTCAYSERHEYLDTFYCRNRNCMMHHSHAFPEICGCGDWESKDNFKRGRCSECRFGEFNAEKGTFTCRGKDTRLLIVPIDQIECIDCRFCSPKPSEQLKPKATSVFVESNTQAQEHLQLYCVRYYVEDTKRLMRIEYLVNASSPKEADILAKECFAKTAYKDERIVEEIDITPIVEKGVIDSSKLYLGSK